MAGTIGLVVFCAALAGWTLVALHREKMENDQYLATHPMVRRAIFN